MAEVVGQTRVLCHTKHGGTYYVRLYQRVEA